MKAFYAGNIPYPDPYIGKYCVILDLRNNFSKLCMDTTQQMCCQQDCHSSNNGSYIYRYIYIYSEQWYTTYTVGWNSLHVWAY